MKHILCPVDGSEPAKREVAMTASLALPMQTGLLIVRLSEYAIGRSGVYESSTPEESERYLAEARVIASEGDYKDLVLNDLSARDPAHAILDFADKDGLDHIVMGAAGKGGVMKLLIGSVSSEVLRKAHCPVTVVH